MPTDTINDQSIPENLKRLLKIYADAWIEIYKTPGKELDPYEYSKQLALIRSNQAELLFKLLIAHVTCEGLSSANYQ